MAATAEVKINEHNERPNESADFRSVPSGPQNRTEEERVLLTKPAIAVLSEVFALCALEFPVAAQDQSGGTRARVQEFLSEGSPATGPRSTSICVSLFDALRDGSSELNFIRPCVDVNAD